jgi:hypothetical protein
MPPSSAARATGPLTAMMQTVDDAALRAAAGAAAAGASTPGTSSLGAPGPSRGPRPLRADDDPFANISLDVPDDPSVPPPTARELPPPAARELLPSARELPPPPERRVARTATSMPATVVHGEVTSSRALPRVRESLVSSVASWLVVVVAGVAAAAGVAFAGWTSESVDLDATLMPVFERQFGVQPPRSFTGRDDRPLDELAQAAAAAEQAGDLPAAAVLWKQVQARHAEDPAATTALRRVLTALGDSEP